MFDNLGISKCDSKKSPTVQNYEVISFKIDCHVCVANKKSYWYNIKLFLSLEVRSWCKCWLQQAMVIGWLWRGKGSPWQFYSSVSSGPILLIWTWTPQITMVRQQTKPEIGLSWVVHEALANLKWQSFQGGQLYTLLLVRATWLASGDSNMIWNIINWVYLSQGSCLKSAKSRLNPGIVGATPLSGTPRCFPGYGFIKMKCFLSTYIQIEYIFFPSGRTWWVCWRSTSAW